MHTEGQLFKLAAGVTGMQVNRRHIWLKANRCQDTVQYPSGIPARYISQGI